VINKEYIFEELMNLNLYYER